MKILWTITCALALALLLADAGAAQDKSKDGVTGYEVLSTSTPGGGGTLESQGITGERTPWSITHVAPSLAGVVNVVVTYYDSKESRDRAKEKELEKDKKKKEAKKNEKGPDRPPVPTYDSRFYDYEDGKLVPKPRPVSDSLQSAAMNSGSLTANGGNGGGHSDTVYDKFGNPSTPTYDPHFYDYKDGKLVPKNLDSKGAAPAAEGNRQTASIQGVVVPDAIYDRQPFSFAVSQNAGRPINIQTADGVVVQQTSTDKYGRIFLPAGLPAGAYLLSLASPAQPIGQFEIRSRAADGPMHASQPLRLEKQPEALKVSERFSLDGHGFSANYADMRVSLTSSGNTEAAIVLAATEDQLKLAPVQQLQPGAVQLRVTNQATGESTGPLNVLIYDIHGELKRQTIRSHGDETQLVITTEPPNQPLSVEVSVASGPVDLGHGRKQAVATTKNGQVIVPVHAEHGSGPFELVFRLAPDQLSMPGANKEQWGSCKLFIHISCEPGYGPGGFCCSDNPTPDGWTSCKDICKKLF